MIKRLATTREAMLLVAIVVLIAGLKRLLK